MRICKLTVVVILFAWMAPAVVGQLSSEPRPFAPGVLKHVPPNLDARDSFTTAIQIPGLNATRFDGNYTPNAFTLDGQSQFFFMRDVWHHDFSTLGLRQIQLGFRNPEGQVVIKHFWYLVYRIRNLGESLRYVEVPDDSLLASQQMKLEKGPINFREKGIQFIPQFSLEGYILQPDRTYQRVTYADQYLPLVAREIQKLEDPNRRLFDKFEIRDQEIPVVSADSDEGLWGVAIWENVNADLDYVSVYARGITNAYRISQSPDGELTLQAKVLQLNFWRPGDRSRQVLDKVRYGFPLVDNPAEQTKILRHYQLPGPQIRIYLYNEIGNQEILIAEIDAEVDLEDFTSPVTNELDSGEMPEKIETLLTDAGYNIPGNVRINTLVQGLSWSYEAELNGEQRRFILRFQPQYWEKKDIGIRFIKSIDYLWIYR